MAAFRYYRFTYTAYHATAIMVQEVELRNAAGSDVTTSGMTVTACGYHNSTLIPAYAYDNTSNQWQHNSNHGHWLQIDLGSGNSQEIITYTVKGSAQNTYTPTGWYLQGSNDLSNWTTISTVSTSAWGANEQRSFDTIYFVPKTNITGVATAAFSGLVDFSSAFVSYGSGTAEFYNPYRDFSISSNASAEFVTWQRAFDIQAAGLFDVRQGSKFNWQSASTVDIAAEGVFASNTAISSQSSLSIPTRWLHYTKATIATISTSARFSGAFNKDLTFAIRAKGELSPSPRFIKNSEYSAASQATVEFVGNWGIQSVFDIAASGALAGAFRVIYPSVFSTITEASVGFSGQQARASLFASGAYAEAFFSGSYDYTPIHPLPEEYDVLYVRTTPTSVAVFC